MTGVNAHIVSIIVRLVKIVKLIYSQLIYIVKVSILARHLTHWCNGDSIETSVVT
jgi:hypothetical protein